MPDYSAFRALRKQEYDKTHGGADVDEMRRQMRVVSVKLDDLERSDEWAIFTKHVEALQVEASEMVLRLRGELEDAVGIDLERTRLRLKECLGAASAYARVLEIPAKIREQITA